MDLTMFSCLFFDSRAFKQPGWELNCQYYIHFKEELQANILHLSFDA